MFDVRICLQLDIRSRLPELAGSLIRIGLLARPGLRVRQGGENFSDGYVYCFAAPLVDHVDFVVGGLPVAAYLEAAFERRIVPDSVRGGQGIGDDIYV